MTRKRVFTAHLARVPVSWACFGSDRKVGSPGSNFVRLVRLEVRLDQEPDREVETRLTPAEARALAARLVAQADAIDAMNAQQSNGFAA